ncbi:MAG: hypothetical protein U0800_25815 [Isosphaeraceae bacterium]
MRRFTRFIVVMSLALFLGSVGTTFHALAGYAPMVSISSPVKTNPPLSFAVSSNIACQGLYGTATASASPFSVILTAYDSNSRSWGQAQATNLPAGNGLSWSVNLTAPSAIGQYSLEAALWDSASPNPGILASSNPNIPIATF